MNTEPLIIKEEKAELNKHEHLSYKRDAYRNANFLSKLFFCWALKIIRLANKISLKSEYLGKLEGENRTEEFLKRFKEVWDNKRYKEKKKCKLFQTLIRTSICSVISIIFLSFFTMLLDITQVIIFREYIHLYETNKDGLFNFTELGIAFLTIKIFSSFLSKQVSMSQNYIGFKTVCELNAFIYEKVLKENPASLKGKSNQGEIINFLQVDSMKISMMMISSPGILVIPFQIIIFIYLLFRFFGISFLFGLITLIIFLSINFYIQNLYRIMQKDLLKRKDNRMKITSETINSLKILKLYGWEDEFLERIREVRKSEIDKIREIYNVSTINIFFLWCAPVLVSTISIGVYQYLVEILKLSDMLACITIFNMIQEPIRNLPWMFNTLMETLVSLNRIEKFLDKDEIEYHRLERNEFNTLSKNISVKIINGNFTWGRDVPKDQTGDKNKKNDKSIISEKDLNTNSHKNDEEIDIKEDQIIRTQLKKINITIKKGEFVGIIGEVGSGKSSLLQAILNNMTVVEENIEDPTKIILNGSVSYISQIPWIQNATLRNNIIFNHEYEEIKYNKIIDLCELKNDLQSLVGGDMTEIGEKGINLSGGQKARVAIARGIYCNNDIYLLDDPISALDSHVGQNIMKNVIMDYLRNKTRVLVTHALQYLSNCDRIIVMSNGTIKWEGSYDELITQDFYNDYVQKLKKSSSTEFSEQNQENQEEEKTNKDSLETLMDNGENDKIKKEKEKKKEEISRITKEEDKEEGNVKLSVYYKYIQYSGGLLVFFGVFLIMVFWQTLKGGADIWLTVWTNSQNPESNMSYFWVYAALGILSSVFIYFRVYLLTRGSIKLSTRLHEEMITKIVGAPINLYHDTTPKGQILNRLSKDLGSLDTFMVYIYGNIYVYLCAMLGGITICAIFMPWCLLVLPFVCLFGFITLRFYISSSRDLSRLDGITRSPLLNTLSETINGAITIRAYQYEDIFTKKFCSKADEFFKVRIFMYGVGCWFNLMLDFFTISFFMFFIISSICFEDYFNAASIGIVLSYSIQLQEYLLRFLSSLSMLENGMISLERCDKYTQIIQEKSKELEEDKDLNNWPSSGKVQFLNFSVKYRPETSLVLKNLNVTFNAGEKIGVVGRTGSGKSTLCLALFRILEPEIGTILIDDRDITKIGLKTLRKNLTIIPQDPILMEGTLKYNIDPLKIYKDELICEMIKTIGFSYLIDNHPLGLEMPITENGGNLSVGEKQLVCITRAVLRKSKIILMDEATANIDIKTEEIIQKAISECLRDSTVITIAHRIKTILSYDKILVLSNGEVVEFDETKTLLSKKDSLFYNLYMKSH